MGFGCQVNPIYYEFVTSGLLKKLMGGSGVVNMIAPLPIAEYGPSPITLFALTLAQIEEPHS
jgi:hypothetical protein